MKKRFFVLLVFVFLSAFSTKSFAQDPNWSVNASNYQFSATYTTFLNVFGNNLSNTNDKVAAFVNGEIRGVGNLVYVPSADKYVAYLTIYANTNNETVDFKIYDSSFNSVFTAKQTAQFRIDANVGTVFQSFAISNENLSSNAILSDLNFKGITPISKVTSRKNSTSNNTIDTYDFLLPNGTDVTQLIPEFSVFFNANTFIDFKKQISGTSVVDFTNAVVYQILSQDEKVLEEFTINVLVATNTALTNTVITSNTPNTVLPKEIEVQFSNPITGFSREDFTLNNAVISKFTKIDSQNFNVEVIPFSNGDFTVAVKPAAVADTDNQVNNASNILSFKNDQKVPIINNLEFINQNGGEYFDITFSEEVLNLDITDFELTGTNSDGYFVSTLQTITSTNFRLNVPKINTKEGSVFLKLNTSTDITDLAGNKIIQQEVASYFVNNTALIAPVLVDVVAECNVTITEIPKITSAVSGEIIATTTDPLTYSEQGEYSINWVFTDVSGNTVTATQKVIVKDNTKPQTPFLADIIATCSVNLEIPTTTDNCSGILTATTTDSVNYDLAGEYLVNWVFNDNNGNITTAQQKVTVQDFTPPIAPVLQDVRVSSSTTLVAPTTTDNCGGIITGTTNDPIFYDKEGQYVVNWFFADKNGNGNNASQNVFIFSSTPTVPILRDLRGDCFVSVFETPSLETVSGTITGTTTDALSYQNQGEYIITWNFDLGNGTILQSEQKVIVKDDFAPEPTFLNDITAECALTITDIPTAFDFCAGNILGETKDLLSYTKKGEYSITWSFNDGNGNTSTAIQKVTITDSTAPNTTTLPDIKAQCSVTLVAPTTTDNCAGTIEATTTDAVFYDTPGSYIVNWVFNDGNGNTTNALQNVIIDNSFAPIAPDLADIIAECFVNVTDIPEVPGNGCSGKVIATTTDSLTYNIQGAYTIVWNFDYGNGTVLQSSQNVIIKDTTAPDIPVLPDIVEECSAIVSNIPTTTDNCAGVLTATTLDTLAYTSQGNYTINWVFNDGNGNISTAKQNVFIKDKTPPIAPILEDISGECSVTVLTTPTTTDNCGETILGTTTNSLSYSGQGTYAVLWSFEDKAGNITIVSQKIIVKDTTIPIIPVLPDIITECAITITNVPTTTDNCNGVITGTTKDALIYNEQGNYQINWLFDDGNGNTITKKQNVIVKDTVMPTIIVKDIEIKLNAFGNASFIISDIDNGSFDNCAIKTYAVSQNKFTINDIGENTVVFSVTDFAGNTISENVKVTVTQDALSTDNFTLDELSTYLYPNPSKNSFKISLGIEKANVHIYDMSGKLVQTNKNYISDKNIDISNLPIGVFIVRISNNNKLITKRLTKTE